jgi:hypothetical protein
MTRQELELLKELDYTIQDIAPEMENQHIFELISDILGSIYNNRSSMRFGVTDDKDMIKPMYLIGKLQADVDGMN